MTILKRFATLVSAGLLVFASHPDLAAQGLKLRVFQNAMAGDAVTIIDPATNTVVGEIPGIEISNGLAAAPDGNRIYVTGEVEHALFVVDTKTMTVVKKVQLTGRPSGCATSKDGQRIFVGIQDAGGTGMDIVDAAGLTVLKNLPLEGMRTHYIFVTPDGKYAAATANGGPAQESVTIRLVDTKTGEFVRKFSGEGGGGHRNCDFYPNPDGSTKWMMCNQGGLSGFVVYDFNTGAVVRKVMNPAHGSKVHLQNVRSAQGSPSHGLLVSPDRKVVAVSDRWFNLVHIYSAPDFTHLYSIPMGVDPFWFAFTPNNKSLYVSAAMSESVSVLDLERRQEVTRIHVQAQPKRIIAAMVR